VVSLVSSIFLLLTYAILAPEKSHRHYLSVGLIVSNVLLQVCAQAVFNTNHLEANSQYSWPLSFH
jgi:peptidoglycan/LPS O-acetylase OafA/YrhL